MHPAVVFLMIISIIMLTLWGLYALKVKFVMNMWFKTKKLFGSDYKKQLSNVCPGSIFSTITDKNDPKLLDYLNGTLWCPKDRLAHEANVVSKCRVATPPAYYPPEVVKVLDQPTLETVESSCPNPTSRTPWGDDEIGAWRSAVNKSCNNKAGTLQAAPLYSIYSNIATNSTTLGCPL